MKPGRELDALVAERIVGRCAHILRKTQTLELDSQILSNYHQCQKCGEKFWGIAWHEGYCAFPSYSTDVAAAWQVDRPGWTWEFQETSHDLTATLYPSPQARSQAIASYPILPEGVTLVRREWGDDKASTYAWVRCLAALRAVGAEVKDE